MMALTFINTKPDMSDPLNMVTLVGVKRYAENSQVGMIMKLDTESTRDEILDAEASCLTTINLFLHRMPTWDGAFLTGK